MAIKKKDFVEIEYTGKITDTNEIFDTTDEATAKKEHIHSDQAEYGPSIVCIGEKHVLPGLDAALEGKEAGASFSIEIKPVDGFGPKDPKLLQMVPTTKFKKQQIQPMPGLQINFDGMVGTVKTVSGGRTMVDFNHPLAGRDLSYDVKINKIVTSDTEKLNAFLKVMLGKAPDQVAVKENEAMISLPAKLPKEMQDMLQTKITEAIPSIKKTTFSEKKIAKPVPKAEKQNA